VIDEKCIGGSVGKYEGKKPLRRPRRRWANNIKMGFREIGWGVDWIDWVRIGQWMVCCECSNEPSASIKCGEFID